MRKWLDTNLVPLILLFAGGAMCLVCERHGWVRSESYWHDLGAAGLVLLRAPHSTSTALPDPLPAGSTATSTTTVQTPPTEQSEIKGL